MSGFLVKNVISSHMVCPLPANTRDCHHGNSTLLLTLLLLTPDKSGAT